MKQKFIEWFTKGNNGYAPSIKADGSFEHEKTQHMFEAYQAGMTESERKVEQLAAENAYLIPKAASELSNAWVLHKYLIGIQAAIMYLDNGNKKAAQEWLYGTIAGPGFEFPDEVDDIDVWATHQMRGSISHPRALEIIKEETKATDAILAEVRAQGVDYAIGVIKGCANNLCPGGTGEAVQYAQEMVTPYLDSIHDKLADKSAQLRQEAK